MHKQDLKVIFLGTTDFAVPTLEYLINNDIPIAYVVTQPDRPKGRGRKLTRSPIKELAEKHKLPLMQPEKLSKDESAKAQLIETTANLLIVVAYGQWLPRWLLNLPRLGSFNLHGSILPKYRGAGPIQWSLINGEQQAGVTLMEVAEKMDAGNIVFSETTDIHESDNFGTLHDRLKNFGPRLLDRMFKVLLSGETLPSIVQDEQQVTFAPRILSKHMVIDWQQDSDTIHNLVRGLAPKPLAFTSYQGQRLKIIKTKSHSTADTLSKPGTIVAVSKHKVMVSCGKGLLQLLEVLPANKKAMPAIGWARGAKVSENQVFGNDGE